MGVYNLLALFLFESFTEEVAFHFNTFLHWPLTLSKVTQVRVGELPLLLPQVTIAQSYACGNVISDYLQCKHCCMWFENTMWLYRTSFILWETSVPWCVQGLTHSPRPLKMTWKRGTIGRSMKLSSWLTRASLTILYPEINTILWLPLLRLNTGPYSLASCI